MFGRNQQGRFEVGNRFSAGDRNPLCRQVVTLKRAFAEAVTADDMRELAERLLALTRDDDPRVCLQAADLLLTRLFGRAVSPDRPAVLFTAPGPPLI